MTAGLSLDEELVGAWSADTAPTAGDLQQYLDAFSSPSASPLTLELHLATDDVARLSSQLDTPMSASGVVHAPSWAPDPIPVGAGSVQLVVADDPADPSVRHMRYRLPLPSVGLQLEGFKELDKGDLAQLWPASTTLYVTITATSGSVVGRGVVSLHPGAFVKQLSTLRITGSAPDHLALLARFGGSFFGALWDDYGTVVHRSTPFSRKAPPRPHRALNVPPASVMPYTTADGVTLRLTRYNGGSRGPVVLSHGMGANNLTFTTDTIGQNVVEYLVANSFDVWLQEWRGSTALPTASTQFTGDDVAKYDHPGAAAAIQSATGKDDLHWVTHCVGSITWMMAVLAGTVTPASLILSQVGAHPIAPRITRLKADVHAPAILQRFGVRLMTTDSYTAESVGARLFDQVLRLYPIKAPNRCPSAVCRRLAFIYGIAVHHPAVDELTHECLHELFGKTDLTMMKHLASCAHAGRLIAADGSDAYMPFVSRAALPMTFIHGIHNLVWLPASTALDLEWLTKANDPSLYTRVELPSNGHQDSFMGAQAATNAFPAVLAHLDRVGA
jgi:cholesterol oxidase